MKIRINFIDRVNNMKLWEFLVFVAIIWLCVIIGDARANEWAINTMLFSDHHHSGDYNEVHKGFGLSYMHDDQIYSVLRYRNSKNNMSTMLSVGKTVWKHNNVNLAVNVGAATGYSSEFEWVPAPVLTFNYQYITFYHIPLVVTAFGLTFPIE